MSSPLSSCCVVMSPVCYSLLIPKVYLRHTWQSAAVCVNNKESCYHNPIVFIHVALTETGFSLNSYHKEISARLSMAPSLCCAIFVTCYSLGKWHISSETGRKFVMWEILKYETIYLTLLNPLKPSGHYMYHQFNIQQFHNSVYN